MKKWNFKFLLILGIIIFTGTSCGEDDFFREYGVWGMQGRKEVSINFSGTCRPVKLEVYDNDGIYGAILKDVDGDFEMEAYPFYSAECRLNFKFTSGANEGLVRSVYLCGC